VCVLEAHEPGWGASGRNGGQVNPTLKHDPDELIQIMGDRAEPLIEAISSSADTVFNLIERHQIDCNPVRSGWLQTSYNDASVPALHRRARQWQRRGAPVEVLDRQELARRTGTELFRGGWLDKRAGSVQPLSYARGLAATALEAGAHIHSLSPVVGLRRNGTHWEATVANGARVTADKVVLATNGYSDGLWPGLAQTVLSANSFIVATKPLGSAAAYILPNGETLSTAQRLLVYMRKDDQGRILLGGRGLFGDPVGPADFAHIERSLAALYPSLAPFEFEYRWGGRIAITRDFLPHVHRPAPGLTIALGYNGRGVAAATAMGRHIAALVISDSEQNFPFPITRLAPFPFHGLQSFYISAGVAWYGLLDRLATSSRAK
jgi:glycine/D-amino acid oxidase-like deaminating enzyme